MHPLHAPGLRCPRAGGRRCGPSVRENQMMFRTQWYPFGGLRSAQELQQSKLGGLTGGMDLGSLGLPGF